MKYLVIVLFLITQQLRHGLSAKLESKGNETKLAQQRNVRVHRVSEYPVSEDPYTKNTMNDGSKQVPPLGNQKILQTFSEKLQSTLPDLSDLVQREAQLLKELNVILKELPRDEAMKLKNIAANEISDIATSASTKSVLKNANHLNNNLLNSPEELSIYHQEQSRSSSIEWTNDPELKAVNNIARFLDNVLMEIQNHITYVRGMFEKLCRKHHSLTRSNATNMGSMNQPKKVSIL